jgi:hypothetical protein
MRAKLKALRQAKNLAEEESWEVSETDRTQYYSIIAEKDRTMLRLLNY